MSKVEIQGLNQRQRALADVLWMMNSRTEVEAFIRALHPTMRREAETVVELMILAVMDQCDTIDSSVKSLLDNYRL